MNWLEIIKFSFKKCIYFNRRLNVEWRYLVNSGSFITIRINPSRKYNLRESKRIFRSTINSCSARIRVSLEYDLMTLNVTPPLLSCTSSQTESGIDFHFQPSPAILPLRAVLVPRPQNYPRLVESLISGVGVRAESDFWWYLSGAPRGPTRFLNADVSFARFVPSEVFNEIKFRVEAGILRE